MLQIRCLIWVWVFYFLFSQKTSLVLCMSVWCGCVDVWVCACVGVRKLAHPLLSKCVLLFVQYYKPRKLRSTIRYWVSLNIGNR